MPLPNICAIALVITGLVCTGCQTSQEPTPPSETMLIHRLMDVDSVSFEFNDIIVVRDFYRESDGSMEEIRDTLDTFPWFSHICTWDALNHTDSTITVLKRLYDSTVISQWREYKCDRFVFQGELYCINRSMNVSMVMKHQSIYDENYMKVNKMDRRGEYNFRINSVSLLDTVKPGRVIVLNGAAVQQFLRVTASDTLDWTTGLPGNPTETARQTTTNARLVCGPQASVKITFH